MKRLIILFLFALSVWTKNSSHLKHKLHSKSKYDLDDMQKEINLDHYRLDRSMDKMQKDIKEENEDVNENYREINKISVESLQEKFQDNQEALGSQMLYADNFLRRADYNARDHFTM